MSGIQIAIEALKSAPGVTRLVGTKRIYPIAAEQDASPPYLVVNMTSESVPQTLEGPVAYPNTLITIASMSTTATGAIELGAAVIAALGSIIKQTIAGFPACDISKADADFTDSADNRSSFRRVTDFYVRWDP